MRRVSSISGSEHNATTQAYTVIMMPVSVLLWPKLAPMSLKRAMGMNSVVLTIKAAKASAATPSQLLWDEADAEVMTE